ncbi:MAG: DUF4827 domain-containing protein [Bacteroides sp.]
MKKLVLFVGALLAVSLAFQACDDTKTYAEMLDEEKDAIKAFIQDSGIVVISQSEFYAQDSTTDVSKNEYVQLASGVYMQIVDKGSDNPADTVRNNSELLVRFSEYDLIKKSLSYSNLDIPYVVDAFRYSVSSSSIAGIFTEGYYMYNSGTIYTSVPAGWLVPLVYVRDRAHVKLIVPSKMGSQPAMQYVYPYFYDIKYQIY